MSETLKLLSQIANSTKPEDYAALVARLAKELPSALLNEAYRDQLAALCHKKTLAGYVAFYELIHGFMPPPHIQEEAAAVLEDQRSVPEITMDLQWDGTIVFAWRGSWKSVSLTETFVCWWVGLEPLETNLIVCANDDSAEKITKAIAGIIKYHPEWKRAFPNIIPDEGSWSVEGFNVIDDSMPLDEWKRKRAAVIDPTFVGGGYKSSRLNGKHPTGCLVGDDIHDRENSASERERKSVIDIVTKVILKTAVRVSDRIKTKIIFVGTPWDLEDAYHNLKKSGQYKFVNIPAMRRAPEGEGVYIDGKSKNGVIYDDIVGWWHLTWPVPKGGGYGYDVQSVISDRATLGKVAFWQMIMLDLTTAKSGGLRYYIYDQHPDKPEKSWRTHGGCDPAYTMSNKAEHTSKNSSFALGYLGKKPSGGAVLMGGVLEKCTPNGAANHIAAAQNIFPNWNFTAVENTMMGQLFIQTLRAINPALVILPSDLGGIRQKGVKAAKAKSKEDRIKYELATWLENATILIMKIEDPDDKNYKFIQAVMSGLDNFNELDFDSADERLDALDALYHAVKSMPDVLQRPLVTDEIPSVFKKPKSKSPLAGIGRHKGY